MPSQNIAQACALIERDLSAPHPITDLAQACGMAGHHFQRTFAAATGETVAGYIRSRRLERAALLLAETDQRILDIALECGFETHAALTRAFSGHFGLNPKTFRAEGLPEGTLGIAPRPYLRPIESQTLTWDHDFVDMPDQWLCWRRAPGMAEGRFFPDLTQISASFQTLAAELADAERSFSAAYPKGPKAFEDPEVVAHYGALLSEKRALNWPEGWTQIDQGRFAVFPHHGPLTTLPLTWNRAVRVGLRRFGLTLRPGWMFETYLASPSTAGRRALTALIHLPVENSTYGKA